MIKLDFRMWFPSKLFSIFVGNGSLIFHLPAKGLLYIITFITQRFGTKESKQARKKERKRKERKINREAKMNLAGICIGFVKSCHFPVTSRVSHLVFSWCRMITHQLSSTVRWVIYSCEVSWHSYSCWCPRKDKESQLQWQSRTPVRMSTPRADGCDK